MTDLECVLCLCLWCGVRQSMAMSTFIAIDRAEQGFALSTTSQHSSHTPPPPQPQPQPQPPSQPRHRRGGDDNASVSLASVSTLTLPPNRPYTRDEAPYEPTRTASGSDSVPIVVPRPIVKERPLSFGEGDDDDDHVASYDDVDPPSTALRHPLRAR